MSKIIFTPALSPSHLKMVRSMCAKLSKDLKRTETDPKKIHETISRFRSELEQMGRTPSNEDLKDLICLHVIADMVLQGWTVSVMTKGRIKLAIDEKADDVHSKDKVRTRHLVERDEQLREPSVREFIYSMERRRLTSKGWHSVFSVMRDGHQLAAELQSINGLSNEEERDERLSNLIQPYLQFIRNGEVCDQTGLLLADIWRYFRHTWVNAYRSVPGRTMMILVRDAGAPHHPVIGIAALGSAIVQQTVRDRWIGWESELSVARLLQLSPQRLTKWMFQQLEHFMAGIYVRDLVQGAEPVIPKREITNPTLSTVQKLRAEYEVLTAFS